MKNFKTVFYIIAVIVALVLIKVFFLAPKGDKLKTAAKPNGMPVLATGYLVKPENLSQEVYVSGEIVPYNQVSLRTETAGKITAIHFKDGDFVEKGSLLVKINDADLQAQLLKNESLIKLDQQKMARLDKLIAINGVSQEEVDILQNDMDNLKADGAYIKAQIAKTSITAPFSGTVGLKVISEGAFVNSTDVIASFVQMKPVYIDFSLPEKYANIAKKGMEVSFQSENMNGDSPSLKAKITAIEPKIDPITKTLKCRSTYLGNQQLFAGSFVKVYVNLGDFKDAIMLPTQSIVPILKGQKVFVAKEGVAQEVKVVTGIRTDDKIQVLEGIHAGDTVLTSGLLSIKKGAKVKITKVQ